MEYLTKQPDRLSRGFSAAAFSSSYSLQAWPGLRLVPDLRLVPGLRQVFTLLPRQSLYSAHIVQPWAQAREKAEFHPSAEAHHYSE